MLHAAALSVLLVAAGDPPAPKRSLPRTPTLILFITVDQLRGDLPGQYADRFGDGGFRLLLDRGVHYTNAHYRHATTLTASGFATLFTGGSPAEHGMIGNNWSADGRHVYSVEDDRYVVFGVESRPRQGTSPKLLLSSTIGDELVRAGDGASRVFAVSIKDRGAIIPAGREGKAFWYSSRTGRFVTSSYYYPACPDWVTAWNDSKPADAWRDGLWTLLHDRQTYEHAEDDDRPFETAYGSLGRVFPHRLNDSASTTYYRTLPFTPMGDELTVAFAETLMEHEQIGRGPAIDLLSVSLSCTDYVGHAFGPNSLEAEDNLLRLDRTIASLLQAVDRRVGLHRTLIVLSSDHGVDASPEHHCKASTLITEPDGCGEAGRHDPRRFIENANRRLQQRFGIDADLVTSFWNPGLYLDINRVSALDLDVAEVERVVAEVMAETPGVAHVVTRSDLLVGRVPDTPLMRSVQRAFHPDRSGNVLIVQQPFWYLYHHPTAFAAMHGSPYSYDTHVPIIIAGPGFEPATVDRRVAPGDLAPTLANYLGIPAPSASTGAVLHEVIGRR